MDEREQWMLAVQARLERVTTTQDLTPVLEETTLTESRELARTLTDDSGSLPARHLLGWLHWYRYQALPEGRNQEDRQAAVTMFTPCFIDAIGGLPGPLIPILAERAIPVASELLARAQRSGEPELLSSAADLWQRILTATPAEYPDRAGILSNLRAALLARFELTGAAADLGSAITHFREAV
jgi:hypothetical protein